MKTITTLILAGAFASSCFSQAMPSTGGTAPVTLTAEQQDKVELESIQKTLCKDARTEVVVYCEDLAEFQQTVNRLKKSKTQVDEAAVSGPLNKLDLHLPTAAYKFVTVEIINMKAVASQALRDAGQARNDQQLSATNSKSGTTSLVSKPGSAALLALALDAGVLTRTVNGTTATLSTNGDQIFRLITGSDPDCTVTCRSLGWFEDKLLNPLAISATLDLAAQNNKTVATTGQASGTTPTPVANATIPTGAGKLSGITARYRILNPFDPRSDAFKTKWKQSVRGSALLKSAADQAGGATDKVVAIITNADSVDVTNMINAALNDSSGKKLASVFSNYFSKQSQKALQDPGINDALGQVAQARAAYRQAWFQALENTVGNLFTFEYDYNRPQNQPITNDFKTIYSYSFQTMGMVTFNGAISLYETVPAGAKYGRTHYGQVSAQYDRTLSGTNKDLQTELSLAGYWQYQPEPSILNIAAGTVAPGTNIPVTNGTQEFVGTAGSLWVTQAKLTIKGAGGIHVPIGVSWSNKTNLLQGSKVGAQVGISYDFSSVAGLFSGSAKQ
jgi:hypothetical protein